jgi:hypothetical protein
LYRYKFARSNPQGHWWERDRLGLWLPPLSVNDPELNDLLHRAGWLTDNQR